MLLHRMLIMIHYLYNSASEMCYFYAVITTHLEFPFLPKLLRQRFSLVTTNFIKYNILESTSMSEFCNPKSICYKLLIFKHLHSG